MSKSDKFWDKTADKYSKKAVPDEEKYQQKLAETQEFLSEDMHVLEFGCGTGTTAIHHQRGQFPPSLSWSVNSWSAPRILTQLEC